MILIFCFLIDINTLKSIDEYKWSKLNKDTQLRRINETFRVLYRSNVK